MDQSPLFRGKKITLMGLGILGRGVGDAEFLAKCGAHVIATDTKTPEELAPSVAHLAGFPNVELHLGRHFVEDFTRSDMVIKAAGVPLDSPEIKAAHAAHVPVVMSTALFAKYTKAAGVKVVGVTGTRGKSTVAHMIFHTLKAAGVRAHIGGNIRGISTLAMFPEVEAGDTVVLELDSWQLQGFGDLKVSPHIAVFTNLMPDHQNYYHDMESYFSDKANIFRFQSAGDALFVGQPILERIQVARPSVTAVVPLAIPADWKLKVIGEHNRENASLAAAALAACGLAASDVQKGLESFEGVEGRLQFVRDINGVKIYNDNNATTPDATVAALRALDTDIILIAGGSDKGLDTEELISEIQKRCSCVILLAGTGTNRVKGDFPEARVFNSLEQAFSLAFEIAGGGDVILFSPAFASFGMFKNEYERNDEFLELVRKAASA